jgi:hypothetical protein
VPAGGVAIRSRAESGLALPVIPRDALRLILVLFLQKLCGWSFLNCSDLAHRVLPM